MSDHTNWRRFDGKKHGRTWDHRAVNHKEEHFCGGRVKDGVKIRVKQAHRSPMSRELFQEVNGIFEG